MKKIICILSLLIACLHIKAQQEINFDTLSAGFQFHHDYELPIITGGYYETKEFARQIQFPIFRKNPFSPFVLLKMELMDADILCQI